MTSRSPTFSNADHKKLNQHLLKLMEAVRDGVLTPGAAQGHLIQMLAAVDQGNYTEPLFSAAHSAQTIETLARQA